MPHGSIGPKGVLTFSTHGCSYNNGRFWEVTMGLHMRFAPQHWDNLWQRGLPTGCLEVVLRFRWAYTSITAPRPIWPCLFQLPQSLCWNVCGANIALWYLLGVCMYESISLIDVKRWSGDWLKEMMQNWWDKHIVSTSKAFSPWAFPVNSFLPGWVDNVAHERWLGVSGWVHLPVFLETFSIESIRAIDQLDYRDNDVTHTLWIFHPEDSFLGGGHIFHYGVPPI